MISYAERPELKLLGAVRTNFPLKDGGAQLFTQYPF
jgi:hypothetical protein